MRKAVFPRFVGLLFVYSAILAALVLIQFSRRSSFTHRMGGLVVRGYYGDQDSSLAAGTGTPDGGVLARDAAETGNPSRGMSEYPLAGEAGVYFGGIEFRVSGDDGLEVISKDGVPVKLFPQAMRLEEEAVQFRFAGDLILEFGIPGGAQELRIQGSLPQDVEAVEIPYRLLRSSRPDNSAGGQFVVAASEGRYSFANAQLDEQRRRVVLSTGRPSAYYGLIPEKRPFNPQDFILSDARDEKTFDDQFAKWRDQAFALWSRTIANNPSETTVSAYLGESIGRGNYKNAVASIPPAFLAGGQWSHYTSVYLGRLDLGLRALAARDREFLGGVSRLINEKSLDFLNESYVVYNLSVRGAETLVNDGLELLNTIDPLSLKLDIVPGIFEGWTGWHERGAGTANPFDRLIDQAWVLISGALQKTPAGDMVLAVQGAEADIRFNFRLGYALAAYGAASGRDDWAAVGRSMVLSVLALPEESGSVPMKVRFNPDGSPQNTAENRIDPASLYHILPPGAYNARALAVSASPGMWTWTAAASISSKDTPEALEIAVSFPPGETHYMIIRGVRPFTKIQLYNIDYRTDPQFERYDSSGWAYSSSEQSLLIKMKHRAAVEYIRIFH